MALTKINCVSIFISISQLISQSALHKLSTEGKRAEEVHEIYDQVFNETWQVQLKNEIIELLRILQEIKVGTDKRFIADFF